MIIRNFARESILFMRVAFNYFKAMQISTLMITSRQKLNANLARKLLIPVLSRRSDFSE